MRKTIKSLEEEIERIEVDRDDYRRKYFDADEKLKEASREDMFKIGRNNESLISQEKNLLEIIRWLINKETAKSPFMPEKSQRDEERGRF
jgi:hypothetical protein